MKFSNGSLLLSKAHLQKDYTILQQLVQDMKLKELIEIDINKEAEENECAIERDPPF